MSKTEGRAQALASRLAVLRPHRDDEIANLGMMAGALYALREATRLEFEYARVIPDPNEMSEEFRQTLRALGEGGHPPDSWLAGFYLNSAMMRLSALNERLDRDADVAAPVRQAVNVLKHESDAHISGRGGMSLSSVLDAADSLAALLERRMG